MYPFISGDKPARVVIVDASAAADGPRAALFFFLPSLPVFQPVFVYQGITAVTLQSSAAPVGERRAPVHHRPVSLRGTSGGTFLSVGPGPGTPASPLDGKSGRVGAVGGGGWVGERKSSPVSGMVAVCDWHCL